MQAGVLAVGDPCRVGDGRRARKSRDSAASAAKSIVYMKAVTRGAGHQEMVLRREGECGGVFWEVARLRAHLRLSSSDVNGST